MATDSKKQALIVISVLIILTGLLVLMVYLRDREFEDQQQRTLMGKETVKLDSVEFAEIPLSDLGMTVDGMQEGYQVLELFNYLEIDADTVAGVTFHARDGSRLMVHRNEIVDRQVFIIPQPALSETAYRLVIPQDTFRTRWLKDILAIAVD